MLRKLLISLPKRKLFCATGSFHIGLTSRSVTDLRVKEDFHGPAN